MMNDMKLLKLKPFPQTNPDTLRIGNQTREACERLNSYYLDFNETINILNEKKKSAASRGDTAGVREAVESIAFVNNQVADIARAMDEIARELDFLVELVAAGDQG